MTIYEDVHAYLEVCVKLLKATTLRWDKAAQGHVKGHALGYVVHM